MPQLIDVLFPLLPTTLEKLLFEHCNPQIIGPDFAFNTTHCSDLFRPYYIWSPSY